MNMKNIGYLALVLAVIMLIALAGCKKTDTTTAPTTTPADTGAETKTEEKPVEPVAPAGETIELNMFDVDNKEVTIKVGATVTWENKGEYAHILQVTLDRVPVANSPRLAQGETFEYTFDKAGTYNWIGTTNPGLVRGTIIVE